MPAVHASHLRLAGFWLFLRGRIEVFLLLQEIRKNPCAGGIRSRPLYTDAARAGIFSSALPQRNKRYFSQKVVERLIFL